jgi:hypothetical protein
MRPDAVGGLRGEAARGPGSGAEIGDEGGLRPACVVRTRALRMRGVCQVLTGKEMHENDPGIA